VVNIIKRIENFSGDKPGHVRQQFLVAILDPDMVANPRNNVERLVGNYVDWWRGGLERNDATKPDVVDLYKVSRDGVASFQGPVRLKVQPGENVQHRFPGNHQNGDVKEWKFYFGF